MITELPKLWHVVVDKDNYKVLIDWRFEGLDIKEDKEQFVGKRIIGVCGSNGQKGHNPILRIKGDTYDFGVEITYEEFRELVLTQEIKDDLKLLKDDLKPLKELLIKLNIK